MVGRLPGNPLATPIGLPGGSSHKSDAQTEVLLFLSYQLPLIATINHSKLTGIFDFTT